MGAWAYMNRELQGLLAGSFHWSCVSRPLSASPATGSTKRHAHEQARIMADAFGKGNLDRMALTLRVPALGESIREATLGAWKRAEGDEVAADEPLVEVESEKATLEVPSPGAGVLRKILRKSGETVAVGDVIAEIDQMRRCAASTTSQAPASTPPATSTASSDERRRRSGRRRPRGRRWPRAGSRPTSVKGSGRGGRISKQDVDRTLQARGEHAAAAHRDRRDHAAAAPRAGAVEPPAPAGPRVDDAPRARGADVAAAADGRAPAGRGAAHRRDPDDLQRGRHDATCSRCASATRSASSRRTASSSGFMSFFVKAAIDALKAFPAVNGEVRGGDIVYKDHYDIGVAVGGGKGLVVPVVRDADRLSFAEVEARDRRSGGARARQQADHEGSGRRHLHDLQRRHLRIAAVDADPEPAPERDPGPARDPEARRSSSATRSWCGR